MTATAIDNVQQNPTSQPPEVEHVVITTLSKLLKQLTDINVIEYPESFVAALHMVPVSTLDMMQEKWSAYVPENDHTDIELVYTSNNIPVTREVGRGSYDDEFGIPVTVLTRQHRVLALWYHKGTFLLLGNGAEIDPTNILLINDQLDRPRWRAAITEVGVSETDIITRVKNRIAREKAMAAFNKQRNEFKKSNPAMKRRKAAKSAKQARRHNR